MLPVAILEAKIEEPPARAGLLVRSDLIHRLGETSERVACILASPGYGKTTLASQWAAHDDRPFAWLTVSDEDEDPTVFAAYLAASLERVIKLDTGVREGLEAQFPDVDSTVVPLLASSVAATETPFVLAIDNVHRLRGDGPGILATLVRHLPEGSQITIVGRGESIPGLPRLRAEGAVFDIGPEDLRLDETEARSLLDGTGVAFTDEEVGELVSATEGWPVGLYFAALARREGGASRTPAALVSGDDRLLADYFRQELLAGLPRELVEFLTRTSVLSELIGELCDAILESSGSGAVLEEIEASNLLLVPLDRNRERYRYHQLFRDLLRHELTLREPGAAPELYKRAAAYCVEHGMIEQGIDYSVAAGDVARVELLVPFVAVHLVQSGRWVTLERWLEWLESQGSTNIAVAVLAAWLNVLTGNSVEAERWADIAERAPPDGPMPDGSASGEAWRLTLRAAMTSDGVERMARDSQAALEMLAPGSPWRPTAMTTLAVARLLMGDIDEADAGFAAVAEDAMQIGAFPGAVIAISQRALIASARGRWAEVEKLVDSARSLINEHGLENYAAMSPTFAVSANVALRRGDVEGGRDAIARAERLRPLLTWVIPQVAVQLRLELARAYLALEEFEAAEGCIHEAAAILDRSADLGALRSQAEQVGRIVESARAERVGYEKLSPAERRLLPLLAAHGSFREIGEALHISPHTVKTEAASVYRKLGVSARTDAVEAARRLGLLAPE